MFSAVIGICIELTQNNRLTKTIRPNINTALNHMVVSVSAINCVK